LLRVEAKNVSNAVSGNWMVEVSVFVVPLDTQIVLSTVLKGLVNWLEVLRATLGGDPSVGWLVNWIVE